MRRPSTPIIAGDPEPEEEMEGEEEELTNTLWDDPKKPQLSKVRARWALKQMGADLQQFEKLYLEAPPGRAFGPRMPSEPSQEEIDAWKKFRKAMDYNGFVNDLWSIHGWESSNKNITQKIQAIAVKLLKWESEHASYHPAS